MIKWEVKLGDKEIYELPYKRRLSIRPGIIYLWQASGRSAITRFEDMLGLDLEYIDSWSAVFGFDLCIKRVLLLSLEKGRSKTLKGEVPKV